MKKVLLFVLAIALVCLVGCSGTSNQGTTTITPGNVLEQRPADEVVSDERPADDTEVIFNLFSEYIYSSSNDGTPEKALAEYRIDNIRILDEEEKAEIITGMPDDYFETDTLAIVTYSVKPEKMETSYWVAGNGEISEDWIMNKTNVVTLRDGELTNIGTGW